MRNLLDMPMMEVNWGIMSKFKAISLKSGFGGSCLELVVL